MIQNPSGPRPGGTASALGISVPTIIKSSAGTFWNINVLTTGQAPGHLYDANSLTGLVGSQILATIPGEPSNIPNPAGPGIADNNIGPFPFQNGLVFVPGPDGMTASIAYS